MTDDYEEFEADIKEQFEVLWELAEQKLQLEEGIMTTYAAGGYGTLYYLLNEEVVGNPVAAKKEDTRDKLLKFAKDHCFDYSKIDSQIEALSVLSDGFDIGESHSKVAAGLSSWDEEKSDTAKVFKENFVYPIQGIQTDQAILIERSRAALDGVRIIVDNNRNALKGLIESAKESLNEYEPKWLIGIGEIHAAFIVIGMVVPPIVGVVVTGADIVLTKNEKTLLEGSGMNVVELFQALRDATDGLSDEAKAVFGDMAMRVEERMEQDEFDDDKYVQKMPQLP